MPATATDVNSHAYGLAVAGGAGAAGHSFRFEMRSEHFVAGAARCDLRKSALCGVVNVALDDGGVGGLAPSLAIVILAEIVQR